MSSKDVVLPKHLKRKKNPSPPKRERGCQGNLDGRHNEHNVLESQYGVFGKGHSIVLTIAGEGTGDTSRCRALKRSSSDGEPRS